jgi:hypothetical protein
LDKVACGSLLFFEFLFLELAIVGWFFFTRPPPALFNLLVERLGSNP